MAEKMKVLSIGFKPKGYSYSVHFFKDYEIIEQWRACSFICNDWDWSRYYVQHQ